MSILLKTDFLSTETLGTAIEHSNFSRFLELLLSEAMEGQLLLLKVFMELSKLGRLGLPSSSLSLGPSATSSATDQSYFSRFVLTWLMNGLLLINRRRPCCLDYVCRKGEFSLVEKQCLLAELSWHAYAGSSSYLNEACELDGSRLRQILVLNSFSRVFIEAFFVRLFFLTLVYGSAFSLPGALLLFLELFR